LLLGLALTWKDELRLIFRKIQVLISFTLRSSVAVSVAVQRLSHQISRAAAGVMRSLQAVDP